MKKYFTFFLLFFTFCSLRADWTNINPKTSIREISSLSFIDQNNGWAVNSQNILHTTDGGDNWNIMEPDYIYPNKGVFDYIYFYDLNHGYGINIYYSMLYRTTDGGKTWRGSDIKGLIDGVGLASLQYINNNLLYGVSGNGDLIKSSDNGSNWEYINNLVYNVQSFKFINKDLGYIISEEGVFGKTTNGGLNWTYKKLVDTTSKSAVSVYNNSILISFDNLLTLSSNSGEKWDTLAFNNQMLSSNISDSLNLTIVSYDGKIWHSADRGKSFDSVDQFFLKKWDHLSHEIMMFVNNKVGYISGMCGEIKRTTDCGKSWKGLTSFTYDDMMSIQTTDSVTAWIASSHNLYKSSDKGKHWNAENFYLKNDSIVKAEFINKQEAFIGTAKGYFYFTNDSGKNWSIIDNINFNDLQDFSCPNDSLIYCCNYYKKLCKIQRNQSTWKIDSINLPFNKNADEIVQIKFINNNIGFMTTDYGFYKTKNGGDSWQKIQIDTGCEYYRNIIYDNKILYILTCEGIFTSIDSGSTWKNIVKGGMSYLSVCNNNIYIIRNMNVLSSSDNGNTWYNTNYEYDLIYYHGTNNSSIKICAFNSKEACAINHNGIIKIRDYKTASKISLISPAPYSQNVDLKDQNFIWTKAKDRDFYTLEIATDSAFSSNVRSRSLTYKNDTLINEIRYWDTLSLNSLTTYYWRARAEFTDTAGEWSDIWSFTTGLNSPRLISPWYDSKNIKPDTTFIWDSVKSAVRYKLQLSKDSSFSKNVLDTIVYNDTCIIKGLEFDQTYYWRVASGTDEYISGYSDYYKFYTLPRFIDPPYQIAPKDFSKDVSVAPKLHWIYCDYAKCYRYQVSTKKDFSELISDDTTSKYYAQIRGLEYSKEYYWRVSSIVSDSNGKWSDIKSFTTLDYDSTDRWVSKTNFDASSASSLTFIDENLGFVSSDKGVFKTTNGGDSWTKIIPENYNGDNFYQVYTKNGANILAIGEDQTNQCGLILYSSDGGGSWNKVSNNSYPIIDKMICLSGKCYMGIAQDQSTYITYNAWNTYSTFSTEKVENPKDIIFLNSYYGLIAGTVLYRTIDAGDSWFITLYDTNQTEGTKGIVSLDYIDYYYVWATSDCGYVYRSSNQGDYWVSSSQFAPNLNQINFIDSLRGCAIGDSGNIYFSSDGGASWVQQKSPTASNLKCLTSAKGKYWYAAGDNGAIVKFTMNNTKVENQNNNIFDEAIAFPNPANTVVSVKSKVGEQWKLIDLKGKVIEAKVSEGETIEFDIRQIPAGTYLIIGDSGAYKFEKIN